MKNTKCEVAAAKYSVLAAVCIASMIGILFLSGCESVNAAGADARAQQGLSISPVPLDLEHKDVNQVGIGSYLVNAVGGCNDCHTQPNFKAGGNPYLGQVEEVNVPKYMAGGMSFGPVCSKNITPDAMGLPAGLTQDAFVQEMRTGIDPGTGKILQVMTWPSLRQLTDSDLTAIYTYLSAIPTATLGSQAQCIPK